MVLLKKVSDMINALTFFCLLLTRSKAKLALYSL